MNGIKNVDNIKNIQQIAKKLSVNSDYLELYGKYKAKILADIWDTIKESNNGKLILVTSINPTIAGEGKTTTSIGLADALAFLGYKTCLALREPSMGPCFGMKGGATGGGKSQIVPAEDINLHFNGDLHAITSAHNLLSAIIDNHIYYGNKLNFDLKRITWRRVLDLNDRSLRNVVIGLGKTTNGIVRESGFDITVSSEIMAILCLSHDLQDLSQRIDKIIVGYDTDGNAIRCNQLKVTGAIVTLLKSAIHPNLVQTLEGTPALVHGGPFANIAHGCNSIIATKYALKLADYTVTEAGFGADLGAEKFLNIKCPILGKYPDITVIVVTIRAIKLHSASKKNAIEELSSGFANLKKHIANMKRYNLPVVVALNVFASDSKEEIEYVKHRCEEMGVNFAETNAWGIGAKGAVDLAKIVIKTMQSESYNFNPLYSRDDSVFEKIYKLANEIYGASGVLYSQKAKKILQDAEKNAGVRHYPVCMAKTQYSFSDDKNLLGAPENFEIKINDAKIMDGAGFIVIYAGDINTMPGLPLQPAAESFM
ncbi:MAG: formate--tetrahydrofolate ligase [Holosporaceae bacterium]|jgi:formate--tetrahydrofolate ligase|nr:formate--tetrahydrofolate ligase [Holosporaceae bacterium]